MGDLERLAGTWTISALEMDGAEMGGPVFDGANITVAGDHFVSAGMGAIYEGTVELDPTKAPKAIDLIFTVGHATGTRQRGIYELKGDRWTICLATQGNRRPRSFATKPESGLVLETLERAGAPRQSRTKTTKTATLPKAAKAKNASEAPAGPPTAWEGDWQMVSGIFNGVPMADDMVKWCTRVTRGDITTVMAGPQVMLRARFTLDDSKRPHHVDYVNLAGSNKGKAQAGIADSDGATLRICMAAPGKPRPANVSSAKGDGRSLTVWSRK